MLRRIETTKGSVDGAIIGRFLEKWNISEDMLDTLYFRLINIAAAHPF